MIVKFFKRGTGDSRSGESVQNYLLDDRKEKEQAKVLRGDPALTTAIINGLDFSKTYTSGCLSFEQGEGEQLTEQQKHELMDSFESCLFADFDRSNISGYWVQHTDKDRLELNFVYANAELEKGRSLTVYNHQTADRQRVYAWKNITIADYQLSDPDDPARKRDYVAKTATSSNDQESPKGKINITKEGLGEYILAQAQQGKINNRTDVISFLQSLNNVEITRQTKRSITIQTPHPKTGKPQKIRLEGSIYEHDFRSDTTTKEYRIRANERYAEQYQQRINELRAMYHNLSKYKSEKLRERYNRDKARADEFARKRYQRDDTTEREPIKQHSDPAPTTATNNANGHTDPRPKNAISPGPTDDPRATGVSATNQAELQRTATRNDATTQSPIDTTIDRGRSGIVIGAYLPSNLDQHNDMVESGFNSNDSVDYHDSFNSFHLQTNDGNRERELNERNQPASNYDFKSVIRNLATRATESLAEYADTARRYITDVKGGATDTLRELEKESEQRQRTVRELIEQAGTATATAKKIILEREQAPSPISPFTLPAGAGSENEKDNKGEFSELERHYGLIPPSDSNAPSPPNAKLQEYGLAPPQNADQIIIEYGAVNKNDNERSTRYQPLQPKR